MAEGIPVVKPEILIRALIKSGFYIHHQSGSHVSMRHEEDVNKRVTISRHNRDLKRGTLTNILKQAGLTPEDFKRLL